VYEAAVVNAALPIVLAAGDEAEPAAATGSFGIGAIVLVVVVVAIFFLVEVDQIQSLCDFVFVDIDKSKVPVTPAMSQVHC